MVEFGEGGGQGPGEGGGDPLVGGAVIKRQDFFPRTGLGDGGEGEGAIG